MKRTGLFFTLVILLTACSPQALDAQTLTVLPTETIAPIPTSAFTPAPTITFTPTATLEPTKITFDISDGVPSQDIQDIQTGFEFIRVYLRDYLGGDISSEFQKGVVVKIVATGLGNQEPGGGGGDATGLNEKGMRPFFDVKHIQWTRIGGNYLPFRTLSDEHIKTASHEYIHGWQNSLGCLTIHDQPLGDWMNEGIAEYIANEAAIQHKLIKKDAVIKFMLQSAEGTDESLMPLESLERGPVWAGHIGYLAIDYLVSKAPKGILSLRIICEQIGKGAPVEDAFNSAFGISKQDFYNEFQEHINSIYIQTPQPSTNTGIGGKIIWSSSYPNQGSDKYILNFCPQNGGECLGATPIQTDGTFFQSLDHGYYLISLNYKDGGPPIGWYSASGMVADNSCGDNVLVQDNKIKKIDFYVVPPQTCSP